MATGIACQVHFEVYITMGEARGFAQTGFIIFKNFFVLLFPLKGGFITCELVKGFKDDASIFDKAPIKLTKAKK